MNKNFQNYNSNNEDLDFSLINLFKLFLLSLGRLLLKSS